MAAATERLADVEDGSGASRTLEVARRVDDELDDGGLLVSGEVVDKFTIERELAQGGMAVVYLARHLTTGELYALKEIRGELRHRPDLVERFQNEAKALAKLQHPCIVTLADAGIYRERPYIVMEYVKGRTLREVLRLQRKPLGLSQTLQIAVDIASALRAAHREGVIHRDLKPENVILQKHGRLKVVDFGVAKLHDGALTNHLAAMVTPLYAAPEQFTRGRVDGRTDVYALGLIILELPSGRYAFSDPGETRPSDELATELQRRAQPNRLIDLVEGCPPSLSALVDRMLSKRREDRPTAAQVVRSLRHEAAALGFTIRVLEADADDDDTARELSESSAAAAAWPSGGAASQQGSVAEVRVSDEDRETMPMAVRIAAAQPAPKSQQGTAISVAVPSVLAPAPPLAVQGPTGTQVMVPTAATLLAARGQTLEQARQAARPGVPPESGLPMLTLTRAWLPALAAGLLACAIFLVAVLVGTLWVAAHLGLLSFGRAGGAERAPAANEAPR